MIWDRFDDAHDDLLDDIHAIRRRVETLKASLREAGVEFPAFEKPASKDEPGPQGWYEDTMSEESAWLSYESHLRKLLADGPEPNRKET